MSGLVNGILTGLGQDFLQDKATEFAEEHFQPTKDPFYETLPNGKKVRRRLPDYCTKQESKVWKNLQNKAWSHDKSLCGCCCWTECIGWAPILAIIPVIGPALMYWVHGKLVNYADKHYQLPADVLVKLHANIGLDLAISLVPILGILFAWLHASSTRNCAIIYNFVCKRALEKSNMEKRAREQEMMAQRERENNRRAAANQHTNAYIDQHRYQEPANNNRNHYYHQNVAQSQMRPPPPAYPMQNQARAQRPYP